jgi:hypothetical protein
LFLENLIIKNREKKPEKRNQKKESMIKEIAKKTSKNHGKPECASNEKAANRPTQT